MSSYTNIGQELWVWAPWIALTWPARGLWLALYTTPEAKRCPPGLFMGGVAVMAEAAHMPAHEVIEALGELRDHRMIERDEQRKLLRLTQLPDKHERASNGKVIYGWWTKWRSLPTSDLLLAHVEILRWLSEPMTADHGKAWGATFGTLFTGLSTRVVDDLCTTSIDPMVGPLVQCPVQGDLFKSGTPDTVCDTVSQRVRKKEIGDQRSGSGSEIRAQIATAVPAADQGGRQPLGEVDPFPREGPVRSGRVDLRLVPFPGEAS